MFTSGRLAQLFVELVDTAQREVEVAELAHLLTTRVHEVIGADAAGLMLTDGEGALGFAAASNDDGRFLEMYQSKVSQGPSLDAFRTRSAVSSRDLGGSEVWPRFGAAAQATGFASAHACAMQSGEQCIGVLTFYSRGGIGVPADDLDVVQAMAGVATAGILQNRRAARADRVTDQLQFALTNRTLIEQAKGFLAARFELTPAAAFLTLQQRARSSQRRIVDVAAEVIADATAGPRRGRLARGADRRPGVRSLDVETPRLGSPS